jgi:hypothetical protein
MEDNLYAPPKAEVADVASMGNDAEVRFFSVSPVKLVVMSFCTLGLYQIYWFYKHWVLIKERSEPDIIPWGRALFGVFWCYSCFDFIRKDEQHLQVEPTLPAGPLAAAWVIATLTSRLPDPFYLLGLLAPLLLIPVQRHVNHINSLVAPDHNKNTRFSAWNWLAVAIGVVLFVLIIVGLAQPTQTTP